MMCKSRGVFLVFARFILLCLFFASFAPLEMARADIADDAGKLIYREENHVFVRDCGYEPISRSCAGGTTQSVDLVAYNKALINQPIKGYDGPPMTFLGILKELGLSSNLDYTRFNDIPYMNQVLQAIEQARRNEPGNFDRIAHGRSASVRVITICSLVHRFLDSQTIFGQTQIQLERDEIVRSNSANSLQLSLNALIFGYDKDIYSLALQQ